MDSNFSKQVTKLRQRAETQINHHLSQAKVNLNYMDEVMYELQVHQTELELQYRELERASNELQALYQDYWHLYEFAPCGYITLNLQGKITGINQVARNLLGELSTSFPFLNLSQYIPKEYKYFYFDALHQAVQTSQKSSVELEIIRPDQSRRWVRMDIEMTFNPRKALKEWRIALSDLSVQKVTEQVRRDQERLQDLQAQVQREQLLYRVTSAIHQTVDVGEMATKTVTEVLNAFAVSRVILAIYNEQDKDFDWVRVASAAHLGEEGTAPSMICHYAQAQQWFTKSNLFLVRDVEAARQENLPLEYTAQWNVRSLLAVGIFQQERLQGTLCLQKCNNWAYNWTESEQELLKNIGGQLAIAFKQARMFQQLQTALNGQNRLQ